MVVGRVVFRAGAGNENSRGRIGVGMILWKDTFGTVVQGRW